MLTRRPGRWLTEAMALAPWPSSVLTLLLLVTVSSASLMSGATSAITRPPVPPPPTGTSCEQARQKCAYRTGCGRALQRYGFACLGLGENHCPDACRDALIILTSTPEGHELMTCTCNDQACEDTKRRVEACRPAVAAAARNESVYSCGLAQWVCAADPTCGTALDYYNRLCRQMFAGRKCTRKCKNSISILRRQKKAAKLDTCLCDGREDADFDCGEIRKNMAHLCFHQKSPVTTGQAKEETHYTGTTLTGDVETNELLRRNDAKAAASLPTRASVWLLTTLLACLISIHR